jgi:hypothetical protein
MLQVADSVIPTGKTLGVYLLQNTIKRLAPLLFLASMDGLYRLDRWWGRCRGEWFRMKKKFRCLRDILKKTARKLIGFLE